MKNPIFFYFGFTSPYGYLASLRIDAIAAQHAARAFYLLNDSDPALTKARADQAIKDRLRAEVAKAVELGVCGSTYAIVDGAFWGADRLDQVDAWLKAGGW